MISNDRKIESNSLISRRIVLNALPCFLDKFISNERQFLLSQLRCSRLLDIFSGVICFPIYSVAGQADEMYIGMQQDGKYHIFLVQVATGDRSLRVSDVRKCFDRYAAEFSSAVVRSIIVQAVAVNVIALIEFRVETTVEFIGEKHYQLIQQDSIASVDSSG
jgi:hypothetical protein